MLRLLVLTLLLHAAPTWGGLSGKQEELKDLRARITQLREEVEKAGEDRKEAADGLRESERRISSVNRVLHELRADERRTRVKLGELEAQDQQVSARLGEHRRRLDELLRQAHIAGDADAFRLLLGGRDPASISRDLAYYGYLARARTELIRDHRQTLQRLQEVRAATGRERAALQGLQRERQVQRQTLDREKRARQTVYETLSAQIQQQRREIETLTRDEARLSRLIEKLRRMAQASKSRAKKQPAEPRRRGEQVERVADASLAGLRFAALRGKLALPVAGEIRGRYGQARAGGGPSWKGLFIAAPAGREVRAVGSGEVVFSDWLRGFGNLLILDHGGGYLSLYSNNESLYKRVGDSVQAGDVVAAVGNTGGQEASGLYFELRRQGQPFDPMTWVR